jgi:hypothetical protein
MTLINVNVYFGGWAQQRTNNGGGGNSVGTSRVTYNPASRRTLKPPAVGGGKENIAKGNRPAPSPAPAAAKRKIGEGGEAQGEEGSEGHAAANKRFKQTTIDFSRAFGL